MPKYVLRTILLPAVSSLKKQIFTDKINPGYIKAVKHGNGEDWWVLAKVPFSDQFIETIVTEDKIYKYQTIKTGFYEEGGAFGQKNFSSDGGYFAGFNVWGILGLTPPADSCGFTLCKFNRCSGELTGIVRKNFDVTKPGGVEFSPDSRFLYVSKWDTILQYDLEAPDILASETVVAEYDGFLDTLMGFNPGFPVRFYQMKLGPDGRIYINIPNVNAPWMHVIEHPNLKGIACDVRQHAIPLPVWNVSDMPNIPNFRLGKLAGSPCDTIVAVNNQPENSSKLGFDLFPNPATNELQIQFDEWADIGKIKIFDILGKKVIENSAFERINSLKLSVESISNGCYFLQITLPDGQILGVKRFIKTGS